MTLQSGLVNRVSSTTLSFWGRYCLFVLSLILSARVAGGQVKWDEIQFRQVPEPLAGRELDLHAKPETAKELAAWYALRPGDVSNTALWIKASKNLPGYFFQTELTRDIPLVDQHLGDDIPDKLSLDIARRAAKLLEKYDVNIIAGVRAAEARGYCQFDVDFSGGINCDVGDLYRIVRLSQLMALAALVAEHRGASKETVFTYVFAANRCLRMIDGCPIEAASIARSFASIRGQRLAIKLVDRLEFTEKQLRLLAEEIKAARGYEAARIAFIGDRVLGTIAFDDTNSTIDVIHVTIDALAELGDSEPSNVKLAKKEKMKRAAATYAKEDRQYFRAAMDALLGVASTPHNVAYRELVKLEDELRSEKMTEQRGIKGLLTPMLLPNVNIVKQIEINAEATTELSCGALAIKLFHLRNGRLPGDLGELIPEYLDKQPLDPWTGRNAVVKISGNTLELRSAGKNQVVEPDSGDSDDLVVKLDF